MLFLGGPIDNLQYFPILLSFQSSTADTILIFQRPCFSQQLIHSHLPPTDTHIHASQFPNAGLFGNTTLLEWLQEYTFPLESSFSSLSRAQHVYNRVITRTLAHGTTTAAYYATIHAPATNLLSTLCLLYGQRAKIGRVCMDHKTFNPSYYRDESVEAAISATEETIAHCASIDPKRGLVEPIITPRFAPSCTSASLHRLGALAKKYELPIQTHIAENPNEVKLIEQMFPDCKSYTDVYVKHNLLTSRTVLGHAIWLNEEEKQTVKDHRASISHCPVSNSYLSSGLCPVRSYLDLGVKVGLGTDVSGGWSGSVLVAAREALGVSRVLASVEENKAQDTKKVAEKSNEEVAQEMGLLDTTAEKSKSDDTNRLKLSVEEALHLATVGGAKCLNLEDRIGTFEVGKEFDAQMVVCGDFSLGGEEGEDELVPAESHGEGHQSLGKRHHEDKNTRQRTHHVGDDNPVELWGQETWHERMAKWVFCGDDRNVEAVWVRGRKVHERC